MTKMDDLSMQRFLRSIDYALHRIETDAFCYGYTDEQEYQEFIKPIKDYYNANVKEKYKKGD